MPKRCTSEKDSPVCVYCDKPGNLSAIQYRTPLSRELMETAYFHQECASVSKWDWHACYKYLFKDMITEG